MLLVLDQDEEREAREALSDAEMTLRIAQIGNEDWNAQKAKSEEKKASEAVDAARARWEATIERVQFQSISRADFEALIAAHPAKSDADDESWNVTTFRPALIAACAVDQSMTEEEWVEFLDSDAVSVGELGELYATVLMLNYEMPQAGVGKG